MAWIGQDAWFRCAEAVNLRTTLSTRSATAVSSQGSVRRFSFRARSRCACERIACHDDDHGRHLPGPIPAARHPRLPAPLFHPAQGGSRFSRALPESNGTKSSLHFSEAKCLGTPSPSSARSPAFPRRSQIATHCSWLFTAHEVPVWSGAELGLGDPMSRAALVMGRGCREARRFQEQITSNPENTRCMQIYPSVGISSRKSKRAE